MPSDNSYDIIKKKVKIKQVIRDDNIDIIDTAYGWKANCLFHAESEPSFKVTESEKQDLWYCHGCKRGGDIFQFVEQYFLYNKRESYIYLAKLAGLDESNWEIPIDKYAIIVEQLELEHSFFNNKGISKEVLKQYGVGYLRDINTLNIKKGSILKHKLSTLKDCIFYPIRERSGLTVGYYTRPMRATSSKYIGESKLHIFGLNGLERGCHNVIIVEGFNDVLKLKTKGIKNILSACGTNFNESMFRIMSEHGITHVTFVPDGDSGGIGYIQTIIDKYGTFNTHGISVGFATIEDGDPDEYIDKDLKFFQEIDKHEESPILRYYEGLSGLPWAKLSTIMSDKAYLPAYELQMCLKDKLGGLVDIRYARHSFYDSDAERMIIGNMLRDSMLKAKMALELKPEYFVIPEYRTIFNFIVDNASVNIDTISSMFGIDFNESDVYGNDIYFNKLKLLKSKRDIYSILSKYIGDIGSHNITPEVVIQNAVNEFSSLINIDNEVVTVDNVVLSTIDMINSDAFDGIPIDDKFPRINNIVRGLPKGKLFIIAGNSGHGKTTLACNIVDSISLRGDYKTVFFTGEMDPEEVMLRLMSIYTGHSYNSILDKKVNFDKGMLKDLMSKNLVFSSIPFMEDLYAKIKMMYLRYSMDVVILDYVQLVHSKNGGGIKSRYEELSYISKMFKNMAKELNICAILVSQLNKSNLNSEVSKIENASGAYNMVSDADAGITIMKKKNVVNSITEGNTEINIDKLRYNQDKVIVPVYHDTSNLRINELSVVLGGQ